MFKNSPPEKKSERKFSYWRLILSCVLVAALFVSTSVGLGFSKFNYYSQPLAPSWYFHTHGLQTDGESWIVATKRNTDEDTVIEALDGNVKITIPASATGTVLDKADYILLVYPTTMPSYTVDYSSTFAGRTYYQYNYYYNFNLIGFSYSNTNTLSLGHIQDTTRSMSIEFNVGDDFIPTNVGPSGYTYDEDEGVLRYENIYRFYGNTALYDIKYKKETWQKYADTSWYNTSDTSFTIDTAEELAGLAAIVNGTADGIAQDSFAGKNITLGDDISLYTDEDRLDGNGKEKRPWVPIGSLEAPFSGNFDGNGNTISGLNIPEYTAQADEKDDTAGLFGMVKGTGSPVSISNVSLEDVNLSAHLGVYAEADSGQSMGALAGYCENCNISNIHVDTLTVNRDAKYVGGIIGRGDSLGNISNCTVENALFDLKDCNNIGGIVGIHYGNSADVNISNCTVSAQFDGTYASAGGIVGFGNGGAVGVENCYFSGSFDPDEDDSFNGGILGIGFSGVDNDYIINNCYADCDADLIGHGYFGYQAYTGEKTIEYCAANYGNNLVVVNSSWSGNNGSFTWESYATDAGYNGYSGTVYKSDDYCYPAPAPSIYWDINTDDDGNGDASADPAQIVKENDHTVTLTATPDSGYEFDKWEIEGDYKESGTADLTGATLTITPQGNITATATFKQAETPNYTLTYNGSSIVFGEPIEVFDGLSRSGTITATENADGTITFSFECEPDYAGNDIVVYGDMNYVVVLQTETALTIRLTGDLNIDGFAIEYNG